MASASALLSSAFAAARGAAARHSADCVVRINSTMNNVRVTVSDLEGKIISRASGGTVGQKHRLRASPTAAREAAEAAAAKAAAAGFTTSHVELQGASRSRGVVLKGLRDAGLGIVDIRDVTPVPMNGTRPKAARRL
jgi:small subunit ribosomal protein S11